MSARGIDFLKNWIDQKVGDPKQHGERLKPGKLAKRLVADAAAKGLTIEDMNLKGYDIEKYIREAIAAPIE
jgi:hypothetical protein